MKTKLFTIGLLVFGLAVLFAGGILLTEQVQGAMMLTPQDDVGTAFAYQGRLLQGGVPVNATCDFRFNLYDDDFFSPLLISGPVDRGNITVSDGYFTVNLDFGSTAFTGSGRQLQILTRCPTGSGTYTTLTPMIALAATPYALSLRPGAVISGSVAMGTALHVENSYEGEFASSGIEGTGQTIGVKGSGDNYGVYGQSIEGYGLYSEGSAHIQGELTWMPKLSYVSVPAAAFMPRTINMAHNNYGYLLLDSVGGKYYAPVQLPHHATVTALAFHWFDDSATESITATLYIDAMGASGPASQPMAQIVSTDTGGPGYGVAAGPIEYPFIDNSNRIYYLELDIGAGTGGYGVVVEYEISETH